MEQATKQPSPTSPRPERPSESSADMNVIVSFGMIVSCRLGDVDKIRSRIGSAGGRIVFQTVSEGTLYVLRARQVERILTGDASALAELHNKKRRRVEK